MCNIDKSTLTAISGFVLLTNQYNKTSKQSFRESRNKYMKLHDIKEQGSINKWGACRYSIGDTYFMLYFKHYDNPKMGVSKLMTYKIL